MPKVPEYQADQTSLGPLNTPQANATNDTFYQTLGEGVEKVGTTVAKVYEEAENIDVTARVNEYQVAEATITAEYKNLKGEAAAKSSDEYKKRMYEAHQGIQKQLTGRAQQKFTLATTKSNQLALLDVNTHAIQQGQEWGVSVNSNASTMAEESAANAIGPAAYDLHIATAKAKYEEAARIAQWDPEHTAAGWQAKSKITARRYLDAAIKSGDVTAANERLAHVEGSLDKDDIAVAEKNIETVYKSNLVNEGGAIITAGAISAAGPDKALGDFSRSYAHAERELSKIKDVEQQGKTRALVYGQLAAAKVGIDNQLNATLASAVAVTRNTESTPAQKQLARRIVETELDKPRQDEFNKAVLDSGAVNDSTLIQGIQSVFLNKDSTLEQREQATRTMRASIGSIDPITYNQMEKLSALSLKAMAPEQLRTDEQFMSNTMAHAKQYIDSKGGDESVRARKTLEFQDVVQTHIKTNPNKLDIADRNALLDQFLKEQDGWLSRSGAPMGITGAALQSAVLGTTDLPEDLTVREAGTRAMWSQPIGTAAYKAATEQLTTWAKSKDSTDNAQALAVLDDKYGAAKIKEFRDAWSARPENRFRRMPLTDLTEHMIKYHEMTTNRALNNPSSRQDRERLTTTYNLPLAR